MDSRIMQLQHIANVHWLETAYFSMYVMQSNPTWNNKIDLQRII